MVEKGVINPTAKGQQPKADYMNGLAAVEKKKTTLRAIYVNYNAAPL